MITSFATRAHNHNFELDACVRSLMDTDFYKLLMAQFIWKHFQQTQVSFSLINRKKSVRLADVVDEGQLRSQLDHVRTLRFTRSELIWLAGNTFYGTRGIFEPGFIRYLEGFSLPEYRLEREDGQWKLTFEGSWLQTTMWEIHALCVIGELRTRAGLAKLSEFELDILFARAKSKLWRKIERLRGTPGLKIADFGTRRRFSFLWQEYVVQAMKSELQGIFVGTSNAFLAMKHDLEAIGTNAHELPMTLAALARQGKLGEVDLKGSQYEVLRLWKETYGGALLVALPDTFGSTQFFQDAPAWVAEEFTGFRPDSKEPFEALAEGIDFFREHGQDPRGKIAIPSDGLDVDTILQVHAEFAGEVQPGYDARRDFQQGRDFQDPAKWLFCPKIRTSNGWGTMETNDFIGCHPRNLADFDPISLVCKVKEVEGNPAVKLSDNYTKATGPEDEVAYYRSVFGTQGVKDAPVFV